MKTNKQKNNTGSPPQEELWARKFHSIYEEQAPFFGYITRKETRDFNPQSNNGKLMIAVMKKLLPIIEAQERQRIIGGIEDKRLLEGILLVIQDMVLVYGYAGGDFIAEQLVKEYGYSLNKWLEAQKKSGYENRIMNKFFKDILTTLKPK